MSRVAQDGLSDDLARSLRVLGARRQFVSAALNMGWQLAGMVIVPVVIGVKLDERFDSAPSYTLVALFFAIGGAVMVIRKTIAQVNQEQAQMNDKPNQKQKGSDAQ